MDKKALADVVGRRAAQYAADAIGNFRAEFDEPRSERDCEVGLQFEAVALRAAACALERRISSKQFDK